MGQLPSVSTSWHVFNQLDDAQLQHFKQEGIEALHAQLLYNRGIKSPAAMRMFLDADYNSTPDPLTLIDVPRALERIQRALARHERITVHGDYDADGVTSAALLIRALRTLGHPGHLLDYYIPNRLHESRGLNIPALDSLKSKGTSLLITTDCASSDVEQVAYANTLGIDVVITDHHHPPEPLPDAYAMVNPWRPDCTYSERYLCGVGIAFKLAQALYRAYKRPAEERDLLDLVAIGTIGDVAPLLGENHTLVRLGLEQLRQTRKPGLLALMQKANLQQDKLRERDISYVLAPRINAAGRMKDASVALELLITDHVEQAARLAGELEALNVSRQQQTEDLMNKVREEARQRPGDPIILVSGDGWPEGIIGLVAGKLMEELNRPVFVLSRGEEDSRGSARSHDGFNLILALRARANLFKRYGGHAQAAGFTIANTSIEELRQHLLNWYGSGNEAPLIEPLLLEAEVSALTSVTTEPEQASPGQARMIDLVFTKPERLKYSTYSKIQQLGPFGAANPEPIFKLEHLRLLSSRLSGVEGRNLRLRLAAKGVVLNGLYIHAGAQLPQFKSARYVNVVFHLEPAWSSIEGESKEEIILRILHADVQDNHRA
jgi:single-stranded-DNA-specific exonuclease